MKAVSEDIFIYESDVKIISFTFVIFRNTSISERLFSTQSLVWRQIRMLFQLDVEANLLVGLMFPLNLF